MKGAFTMSNENKEKLIMCFLVKYPFMYEDEYRSLQIKMLNTRSDDFEKIGRIFDEHENYIIDYFSRR